VGQVGGVLWDTCTNEQTKVPSARDKLPQAPRAHAHDYAQEFVCRRQEATPHCHQDGHHPPQRCARGYQESPLRSTPACGSSTRCPRQDRASAPLGDTSQRCWWPLQRLRRKRQRGAGGQDMQDEIVCGTRDKDSGNERGVQPLSCGRLWLWH
jgi:hypothetical protein